MFVLIVISWYLPTEENEDDPKETYEKLDGIWDIMPNHYVNIVLGDFNSKVIKEVCRLAIGQASFHDDSFYMTNEMALNSTYFY